MDVIYGVSLSINAISVVHVGGFDEYGDNKSPSRSPTAELLADHWRGSCAVFVFSAVKQHTQHNCGLLMLYRHCMYLGVLASEG